MKNIVGISLGSSHEDLDFTTELMGQPFRIRRFGVEGDLPRAVALVEEWRGCADLLAFGGVTNPRELKRLERAAGTTPTTTGRRLQALHDEWAVRRLQREHPGYFTHLRALFISGLDAIPLARALSEQTRNLVFADPMVRLGAPIPLESLTALERYGKTVARLEPWGVYSPVPLPKMLVQKANRALTKLVEESQLLVTPPEMLNLWGARQLTKKIVFTSAPSESLLATLKAKNVYAVVDRSPRVLERPLPIELVDGVLLTVLGRRADAIPSDEYLRLFERLGYVPALLYPSGRPRRINRFAFVIHPLSRKQLQNARPVAELTRRIPVPLARALQLDKVIEKVAAYSPPFVYSKVTGVRSPEGVEAEGWLISLGGTPKEMLARDPEATYKKILEATEMAEKLGAQVMGLGAFTKVVGDAGLTVSRQSRVPVTTGNSYSASGALWAAHDAAKRMRLLRVDAQGVVQGKAMVVGATGSIGSVCARLLAMAVDEVTLVAPTPAKLITLKESILRETPRAKIRIASNPDDLLPEMDMIVTATSGAGKKKVLDIMKVKPGAIITDVARPLDLSAEDVAKRPDVLVIESGEIELPGHPKMRPIGLAPNIAYACLAETIVLALEGRFESYTVGRDIEWERVKEIYKLGLKHGMRLAAISGVNGVFDDAQIAQVRERALEALAASPVSVVASSPAAAPRKGRRAVGN